jgi:hypothetical protein
MVTINTNVAAAYGNGPEMSAQIQATEALKALDNVDRAGSSEAQVQERVARRTESVIVTISPEARALRAVDAQLAAEVLTEANPTARTVESTADAPMVAQDLQAEPVDIAPVSAPVVRAEPDPVEQPDMRTVSETAEAPAIEIPDDDISSIAPDTIEQTTSEATEPAATQVARPEQSDGADDGEESAQRAAAEAEATAESTDGDASDVQPI